MDLSEGEYKLIFRDKHLLEFTLKYLKSENFTFFETDDNNQIHPVTL
jgi:hypothetical protein